MRKHVPIQAVQVCGAGGRCMVGKTLVFSGAFSPGLSVAVGNLQAESGQEDQEEDQPCS